MRRVDRIWASGVVFGLIAGGLAGAMVPPVVNSIAAALARPKVPSHTWSSAWQADRSAWDVVKGAAPTPELQFTIADDGSESNTLYTINDFGGTFSPHSITATDYEGTGKERVIGTLDSSGRFRLAKGLCTP